LKKILFLLITLSLIFSFVNAQNEVKLRKFETPYVLQKNEKRIPGLSEKLIDPFKELDDFVREKIAKYPSASFFILTPSGQVVQQGIVDEYKDNILTINSQGFKMSWIVATDTEVIFASSTNDIATGTRVKAFGNWDGNNLNAKKIVVLEKKFKAEIESLIQRLKEVLQKLGINIDLTPLLQQLQR